MHSRGVVQSWAGSVLGAVPSAAVMGARRIVSRGHRRSQDFVWGALFAPKKLTTFFSLLVVALKDRLNIPPNLSQPAKTVLNIDSCSLALAGDALCVLGGALIYFSCKLGLKNFFPPPWGCRCTHCTPWLRLCQRSREQIQGCKKLTTFSRHSHNTGFHCRPNY